MLKNEESTLETTTKNMKRRSYRVKNFLEELPTLEMINKRTNNKEDNICIRCKVKNENWNHVWECEHNSTTLYEIEIYRKQKEIIKNKKVNKDKVKGSRTKSTNQIVSDEKLYELAKNNLVRNNKKLMSRVIADRYIEILITKQEKVQKIWSTTYIYDLEYY
ncbi:hypothetical protein C1645_822401 [Glomus cerebriforme]|uniref:Uncharacterized protein n=1 Tax=Glomus cerebriforme TaxID=658196 RepID=A0A397T809_9GLOM|nr:hypothetical protein C1645_822401 [Glomus cerebriforme]